MDRAQAIAFSEKLLDSQFFEGWSLIKHLGHGKSAVILLAEKDGVTAALKIFHPQLIESYGLEAQIIRINREKLLIGSHHDSIVEIIDTGVSIEHKLPFVLMEYVEGANLSEALDEIPSENIGIIVQSLAKAAKYLEDKGIVHRDIKPDNIKIANDLKTIKLLDFGVMKPVGDNSATEQPGHRPFVGTHQYCPPEMIHNQHGESIEAWRAITFYQIGAVTHDLVMKKKIFNNHADTIANLVKAIDEVDPQISNGEIDNQIISTSKICLKKLAPDRLNLKWEDFYFEDNKSQDQTISLKKDFIKKLQQASKSHISKIGIENIEAKRLSTSKKNRLKENLRYSVDGVLNSLKEYLPPKIIRSPNEDYPNPTIHCSFIAASEINIESPFNIELSLYIPKESDLIKIYVRAGEGKKSKEISWSELGTFLYELDKFDSAFEAWVIDVLRQIIIQQH